MNAFIAVFLDAVVGVAGVLKQSVSICGDALTELMPRLRHGTEFGGDTWRQTRRPLLWVAAAAVGLMTGWVILTIVLPMVGMALNPYLAPSILYAYERQSAVGLFDRSGLWLGILPPTQFADFSNGEVLPADHVTVPSKHINPVFRRCLVALEDRGWDNGLSRWLGTDPIANVSAMWDTLRGRARGASTMAMMASRMIENRAPDRRERFSVKILRKLGELVGAGTIVDILNSDDPEAADRFISAHLPLVAGVPGSGFGMPLYGTTLASRVLWNQAVEDLRPEQAAILASAVNLPILLVPPGDEAGRRLAERRWTYLRARADICLAKGFPDADGDILAARRRLAQMALPDVHADAALTPLLPQDPRERWRILVNPVRRAQWFAKQELTIVKLELDQHYGPDWRGRVLSVRLTTSAIEMAPFVSAVRKALQEVEQHLAGRLVLKLTGVGPDSAHVVVVVADPVGQIRAFYSSHTNIFGTQRDMIGSVAKMWAAVALGEHDLPTVTYCAAPHRCGVRYPAITAFARSMNEPLLAAMYRLDDAHVREIVSAFGLTIPGDTPARTAVVMGIVQSTPRQLLGAVLALGHGIAGEPIGLRQPDVIDWATVVDVPSFESARPAARLMAVPDTDPHLRLSLAQRNYIAQVLAAPLKAGGTLAALGPYVKGTDLVLAKTGTVAQNRKTYGVLIAGFVMHGGQPWPFLMWIAAPDVGHPLGSEILSTQFVKVGAVALRAALGMGE